MSRITLLASSILIRLRRMALAAKGLSFDPVTGRQRESYKESTPNLGNQDEEADIRSPILNHHQSYQNPYNSR
jgi:hypothetical protein